MRGIKGLIYETSLLDPEEGIRFRGYSISECQKLLPKAPNGQQPLPEGLFWLLVTGEIPTDEQTHFLSRDWIMRAQNNPLPDNLIRILTEELPKELHPMTQLSIGVMLMQQNSLFKQSFQHGISKELQWESAFEDINNIISVIPSLASLIYRNRYQKHVNDKIAVQKNLPEDWAGRFAMALGFENEKFHELMRLYMTIHSDHEGGNVSAHTTHLVGSALSDPYLAIAAGFNGLAGPLHGLANQEVLEWTQALVDALGFGATDEQITKYIWHQLQDGQVIPGYGHAVLRKTDPRYTCQREFALQHLPQDPYFKLTSRLYELVPKILTEHGKTKNPWPNVDAHSGILLQHFGLVEKDFYTVLFAVSRTLGALSGYLWDRALGFPIERPKSMTSKWIEALYSNKADDPK